jgi:phasin family protein
MSQKPKAGTPARAASANKAAPKEAVAKVDPPAAEPVVKVEAVEPEAAIAVPPAVEPAEVAEVPAMLAEVKAEVDPSFSVDETISAASDVAAASAKAVSATITATADTVAAVTSEVVEAASPIELTQPTITRGMKTMMKTTEDFVAFGQANLEAFVKSGQIWSAGVQELTKQIATSAKASFDESVSTFKAMSTVKSVKEAMDLQSTFAKAALEKAMAESNKLTDASIKLTEQTLAPITARVTVAVESFGKQV